MDEHNLSPNAQARRSLSASETLIPFSLPIPVPMTTIRPVAILTVGSQSDVGRERGQNQDSLMCFMPTVAPGVQPKQGWLFAVADGMGGYAAGEVASQIAVQTVVQHYAASEAEDLAGILQQGVAVANQAIWTRTRELGVEIMGTTLVCAAVRNDELYVAHVGDSRAYLLRGDTLKPLTRDHSLVSEQVRQGLITEAEALQSDLRSIVTRALGMYTHVQADISGPITLNAGDVILLCSDGVCGYVPEDQIRYILQTHRADPQAAAELLVEAANAVGGFDNATAVVVHVSQITQAPLHSNEAPAPAFSPDSDKQPSSRSDAQPSDTATGVTTAGITTSASPPAGADLEQTSERLPTLDSKPQGQSILGWREAIPLIILVVALLAEALVFTSAMRRNTAEPGLAMAPSLAYTQTVTATPAPAVAGRSSVTSAPHITLSVSITPQPPLIAFTHLSTITTQARVDAPSIITLTLRTNASLVEPTTFDILLDPGQTERVVRIELAPQVNFNREEQVKIEALAETSTDHAGDINTWSLGTFGLASRPVLRMRSRLTLLLALHTATPVEAGVFPVRLFIRWLGTGAIPGDFKPDVSTGEQ